MKKFGFSRKKDGDDDSENRSALFGSRSNKDKPQAQNPYAQSSGTADPYAPRPKGNMDGGYGPPPPYSGGGPSSGMDRARQEKSPVPPGGYGGGSSGGQGGGYGGQGSYGGQGGYGANRYGNDSGSADNGGSRYGPGGYGGMGARARQPSNDSGNPDAGRAALFGDAPRRVTEQQEREQNQYGGGGGSGDPSGGRSYGAYGDRELTAEEQEEEDVSATKQQIRQLKQQDVASTRNALRLVDQAYQTGSETLGRLGSQGERLHNTETNLDLASNQNRLASEKAAELKTLNRSMFAVHVGNPFTSERRRQEAEDRLVAQNQRERAQREISRFDAYQSKARQNEAERELRGAGAGQPGGKASLQDRAKYQFEADSEDEDMENEIDRNLDQLHGGARRLKTLAGAMGREVEAQNKVLDRLNPKVDNVDDEIQRNKFKLDRIR